MNVFAHALLPLIAAGSENLRRKAKGLEPAFQRAELAAITLAGALPDILTPHLSLRARFESWSHTLPFWAGFTLLAFAACLIAVPRRRRPVLLATAMSLAVALHLVCDALAGGIAWLQPFAPDIIGVRLIPYQSWIFIDIACLVTAILVLRQAKQRPLQETLS